MITLSKKTSASSHPKWPKTKTTIKAANALVKKGDTEGAIRLLEADIHRLEEADAKSKNEKRYSKKLFESNQLSFESRSKVLEALGGTFKCLKKHTMKSN